MFAPEFSSLIVVVSMSVFLRHPHQCMVELALGVARLVGDF